MAYILDSTEIETRLGELPGWSIDGQMLQSVRTFKNFIEAINFVNKLVDPAETARHHPDIGISYKTVTISLTTHDAGGLTEKDFELAKTISRIV